MLQKMSLVVITVFCIGVLSAQPYKDTGVVQSYFPGTKTVQKLKLVKDAVIQGISFDKDSVIEFYSNGKIKNFFFGKKQEVTVQGVACKADFFSKGVFMHSNGRLMSCIAAKDQIVQGVPCVSGPYKAISFHQNGKISSAYLSGDALVGGVNCSKTGYVNFHPNGRVATCVTAKDYEIYGIPCRAEQLYFHDTGKVKGCVFFKDKRIGGRLVKKDSYASFDKWGRITDISAPK